MAEETGDIELLKERISSLERSTALASRIADLQSRIEQESKNNVAQIAAMGDRLQSLREFQALKHEVTLELSRLRWIGSSLGIVLTIAATIGGMLGFKSVSDYIGSVKTEVNKRIDDTSSFVTDYTRALSLADARSPDLALPLFKKCYTKNPWDEGVLIGLMAAMDNSGEFTDAGAVVRAAHADKVKFDQFSSATTFNNFGAVEIDLSLTDPGFQDVAADDLNRALRKCSADDNKTLSLIYFNYWRLAVLKGEFASANQWSAKVTQVDGKDKKSWEELTKNNGFLKTLFIKHADYRNSAESSWRKH